MAAPHQATVVTDRLRWRYSPLDAEVDCPTAVLETIRRQAVEGLTRLSRGGLETGGILLGRRTDRSLEIVGVLPIECEHKLGPLFILSAADEKSLDAALKIDKLGTLQPVGLYVSHSRQGFSVAETDAKILDRLPPGPWQLALIVMPARVGRTRTGFFIRASIEGPFVCAHELMLAPVERRLQPPAAPITPVTSIVPVAPIPRDLKLANTPGTALQRPYSFLLREYRRWQLRQWSLTSTLAFFLLCVLVGGLVVRGRAVPSPPVPLHVSDLGSKLRIEWDSRQKAIRAASAATLEIRDGGGGPINIPITRRGLDDGGALYVPKSDNLEVRLKLMQGKRPASESVIYFINPSRPAVTIAARAPAKPAVAAAVPAVLPAAAAPAPLLTATVPALLPAAPAARVTLPAESTPPMPPQVSAPAKPAPAKPAPKAFHMPESPAINESGLPATILPDLPDIHANPATAPSLPLVNSPSIAAIVGSPARPLGAPQLRTGHLIWTGSLRKNAVLTLSADGASNGVLNGRLPGVPVKISLQPAELVDGGIAVYSREERSGSGDQPTTWNGWNIVVLDWDPKRIAEADIVEAPGPANNWKRVVLRNGNRSASVVIVNWQRVTQ